MERKGSARMRSSLDGRDPICAIRSPEGGRPRFQGWLVVILAFRRSAREADLDTDARPGESWRRWEVDALVAVYFGMLDAERRGEPPIKAEVNRELQELLPARTRGSIEYKLQNVSAVLEEQHRTFVDGYKPARNFQAELRQAVIDWIGSNRRIAEELASYGDAPPPVQRSVRLRDVLVERPTPGRGRTGGRLSITQGAWGALRDAQMRDLGEAGERWVTEIERAELKAAGRSDLAVQVEWTSRDRGDGFGFDVSSFQPDGLPIQIEVKTTNLGPRSPFYVTRNEVAKSEELADTYRLYRVFDFARDARVFVVPGSVRNGFAIEPMDYVARIS